MGESPFAPWGAEIFDGNGQGWSEGDPPGRRAVHDAGAGDVRLGPARAEHEQGWRGYRGRLAHLPERFLGRAADQPAGRAPHERRDGEGAEAMALSLPLVRVPALAVPGSFLARARKGVLERSGRRDGPCQY